MHTRSREKLKDGDLLQLLMLQPDKVEFLRE